MNEKKVALITGASRGIGQAIAQTLAAMDLTVIGTATSSAGAEKISNQLQSFHSDNFGTVLNLDQPYDNIQLAFEAITKRSGPPDILINNAGITRDNLFIRLKTDDIESVMRTNLLSVMHLTQLCVKAMVKKRWGRIVNIGSVVGSTGNPGQTNYAASKAGLIGFSKSLAHEVAKRHITVNTVAPGFIETDMTKQLNEQQQASILQKIPMDRLGQVVDVAYAVRFLCSEHANYITGQTLHINGGMSMH
jgi:3-oxoacyl-[acyl-carrier protein] reductase